MLESAGYSGFLHLLYPSNGSLEHTHAPLVLTDAHRYIPPSPPPPPKHYTCTHAHMHAHTHTENFTCTNNSNIQLKKRGTMPARFVTTSLVIKHAGIAARFVAVVTKCATTQAAQIVKNKCTNNIITRYSVPTHCQRQKNSYYSRLCLVNNKNREYWSNNAIQLTYSDTYWISNKGYTPSIPLGPYA